MKLRWLAISTAVAAFSVGPWTFAQVSDQDKDQPKSGDVQNAPKQTPAALPTQDDSQIKHDGGKTDVDAVGNRNVGCGRGGKTGRSRAAIRPADRIADQAGQ